MTIKSEYRINVIESFKELNETLEQLEYYILEKDKFLPSWFENPKKLKSTSNQRQNIFNYIKQIEYVDLQEPKEILVGPGIVAASAETLNIINKLNLTKENLKKYVVEFKKANSILKPKERDQDIVKTFQNLGFARIHLKQCYRKIVYFDKAPEKITWTWANTRSIKKISQNAARELLSKHPNDPGIQNQIQKLDNLNHNNDLAIVQNLAPHLRANIVFNEKDCTVRKMVKGPMPFFFPFDNNSKFPEFTPPKEKQKTDKSRVTRSDVKLDPIAFLPAIRAHQYVI